MVGEAGSHNIGSVGCAIAPIFGRHAPTRHRTPFDSSTWRWHPACTTGSKRGNEMLRFDHLIRASMTIRDVKAKYPGTSSIFENFGFREVCDDCSIEIVARRQGIAVFHVVDALNTAITSPSGSPE